MCKYTHCKSGTVRAVCQTGSAVYIRISKELLCICHNRRTGSICYFISRRGRTACAWSTARSNAACSGRFRRCRGSRRFRLSCLCRLLGCRFRLSCLAFARIRLYCSAVGSLRCFGRLFGSCRGFLRRCRGFRCPRLFLGFLLYLFQVLDRRIRFLFQFFFFRFLLLLLSYGNCLLKVYLCRNIIFIHISDQIIIDGNLGKIALFSDHLILCIGRKKIQRLAL